MKYLLDTHALLWSFFEPERLSEKVRGILLDDACEIYYSPVSLWEISIKYGLNKLRLGNLTPEEFFDVLEDSHLLCQDVNPRVALTSFRLPRRHADPFDRFLIWEAIQNDFTLVSMDGAFSAYTQEGLRLAF
jgi:PIN domain nuclease of toxin-antitoxin system